MYESVERETKLAGRKMAQLRGKAHFPARLLDLVDQVMTLQAAARGEARVAVPERESLTPVDKVIAGAALLPRERFTYDEAQATRLFGELASLLSGMGGPMAQAAAMALEGGEELMRAAFAAHIAGERAVFDEFSARCPQAPRALDFLAQSSLSPSVTALAEAASSALPQNKIWAQATCPVCGSLAYHSSLRGKEGGRVNHCSFCRAAYRTIRLQCAYCQERDAAKLPYFTADEEPGYRVETCETCKGYIKITDFRDLDRPALPVLDDLESMTLDILASRKGFTRPTVSVWGF